MSLFEKLRFAMSPSGGYKVGKLYSWFPTETQAEFDASAFDVSRSNNKW